MITQKTRDRFERILIRFGTGKISEAKTTKLLIALGVDPVEVENAIIIAKGGSDVVAIEPQPGRRGLRGRSSQSRSQ